MEFDRLVKEAEEARNHAYAPYSNFKVGAAVLTPDGQVFTGANIENASYGLTVCAERVAIFKAVSAGHREIKALALVAGTGEPPAPCGACRQIMVEFGPEMVVVMENLEGQRRIVNLAELIPFPFVLKNK